MNNNCNLVSCLFLLLSFAFPSTHSQHVRRASTYNDESPPFVPGGFGSDPLDSNEPELNLDEQDQGIRNGFDIPPLPWFAVFQGGTLCGGSLIHGDIVLTAAHCVDDNGLPPRVRVGAGDYYNGGIVTDVVDGVLHPSWSWRRSSDPDLAVLKLSYFLPNQVAIVNDDNSIPAATQPSVFAMGFGLVNDNAVSRTLKGGLIPYVDDCSRQSYTYNRTRHLCADSRQTATCGGDSGAPVTLGMSSNLQVGINSYSNGKCSSQTIDVYTRVSVFADWIKEQVCALSARPPEYCFTEAPTEAATTISPTTTDTVDNSETMDPSETDAPTGAATSAATGAATGAASYR
ncbi:Plasminogen (Fragment) [Seminavis robusta]|uniref:Plasminogen n=1 Tax=Seminavis robusta TaxID=568900 RepID=A0A9N8DKV9_9STRA